MAEIIFSNVKCSECGQIHSGSPSFSFQAPAPYLEQSEKVKNDGQLGSDLCRYSDDDGLHNFIRVVLEIPINGVEEPFLWGVWVSLSEKNFNRYVETSDAPDESDRYFGWLCNYLPFYKNTYALKTTAHPRANGQRPYIELEKSDHELSVDFYKGISIEKAKKIWALCLHNDQSK